MLPGFKAVARAAVTLAVSLFAAQALANGALAVDGNQGSRYGFSYNYPNMGGAEQRALSECGGGCSVVLRFSSGCGAWGCNSR